LSLVGSVNFDGNGGFAGTGTYSESGVGANLTGSGSGTYSVNSDGTFTFTDYEGTVKGAISSSGDTIIYANVGETAENGIGVGIRK